MYEYVYLKITLVGVVIWLILFLLAQKQREEMVWLGIIGAIAGPIQEIWYNQDYWHPRYFGQWPWLEDILFGFVAFSIASAVYEMVFRYRLREAKNEKTHSIVFFALSLGAIAGMGLFLPFMNSIYAAMISFGIVWLVTVSIRHDLLWPSLLSSALAVFFMFLGYKVVLYIWPGLIQAWWNLNNVSGVLLSGIPLEEYAWFLSMGLAIGPLYELWRGIEFKRIK